MDAPSRQSCAAADSWSYWMSLGRGCGCSSPSPRKALDKTWARCQQLTATSCSVRGIRASTARMLTRYRRTSWVDEGVPAHSTALKGWKPPCVCKPDTVFFHCRATKGWRSQVCSDQQPHCCDRTTAATRLFPRVRTVRRICHCFDIILSSQGLQRRRAELPYLCFSSHSTARS
jgi:hypothetical protein